MALSIETALSYYADNYQGPQKDGDPTLKMVVAVIGKATEEQINTLAQPLTEQVNIFLADYRRTHADKPIDDEVIMKALVDVYSGRWSSE